MNIQDIGALFTERVNEYLAHGYRFCINTMGGSQGEDAKVDLTNGKDFIRVMVDRCMKDYKDCVAITVGKATNVNYKRWREIVWNNSLQIISEDVFYEISRNYYGTIEEVDVANAKRMKREHNRLNDNYVSFTNKTTQALFLPFVRAQKGCKSARASEICVCKERSVWSEKGRYTYYVKCRGHAYSLN